MNIPQFLLVNCLTVSDGQVTGGNGRSVAFPVARARAGGTLFATCSHTVVDHLNQGNPLLMLYSDGAEVETGGDIRNNVIPPKLNYDLSFIEIETDRKVDLVRLSTLSVTSGMELNHVRNVYYRPDFPDKELVVTRQTVGKLNGSFAFGGDAFYQASKIKGHVVSMPKRPHKGIGMRSWPGVSGSPLWDKYGNVLGMVAGGTEKLTEENPEYNLVYLPTKQIQTCLKKFLRDRVA